MQRRALLAVPALCAALSLTACAPPAALPEFERDQTASDRASEFSAGDEGLREDSVRRAGEARPGVEVFLAIRSDAENVVCAMIVRDGAWESTGCGAELGVGIETGDGMRIEVGNFSFPDDAERTSISESVRVLADG